MATPPRFPHPAFALDTDPHLNLLAAAAACASLPCPNHVASAFAPSTLDELLRERAAIEPIRRAVPHLWALLDAQIARHASNPIAADALNSAASSLSSIAGLVRAHSTPLPVLSKRNAGAAASRKRVKIPVPADKFPEYNFVGRLLGPRGTTLKTLERDTGCKIMIRGKGSIRKDKEPDVRGKPGYEHVFNEPLHVVIEVSDVIDDQPAARALKRAKDAVELLLVPVPEERDGLKRQQLRALAIMNGTYRGAMTRSHDALPPMHSLSHYGDAHSGAPMYMVDRTPSVHMHAAHTHLMAKTPMQQQQPGLAHTVSSHVAAAQSFDGEEAPSRLRRHHSQPIRFPMQEHAQRLGMVAFDLSGRATRAGRRSPSSGATSPKGTRLLASANSSDDLTTLTANLHRVSVDDFTSSVDDSPESSHSSEDGGGDGHGSASNKSNGLGMRQGKAVGARVVKQDTCLGVGGFMGQEFYNGAFSNQSSAHTHSQWADQSGLFCVPRSAPSLQVLTKSTASMSTCITPIQPHDGY